ncbi:hypothetical protein H4CHR_02704 [Variovorax sp. PBS-H4]|uniref:hypothetical protein n=1 Tax=Variovorax sp. PBS-H4 TaxID=434008 RepID=UPI001318D219|nr:hypothetical protein [Variovorax sp. PBS-H4]VTU30935.1 hypothetical protein H4CHR_02704 [Variovorax sp. PBS-H4]
MLELGVGADILRGIGWLYIALACGALYLVIRHVEGWLLKALCIALVVGVFGYVPAKGAWDTKRQRDRYQAAKALFDERCKTAGERVYRTEVDIKGVYLMRLRDPAESGWFDQQFNQHDVFTSEDGHSGQAGGSSINSKTKEPPPDPYILSFLKPKIIDPPSRQTIPDTLVGRYDYVEATDPRDGRLYRYTARSVAPIKLLPEYGEWVRETELVRSAISKRTAKYGVTWKDISESTDRQHWIAGSEVRIFDLDANELIAERAGYVMDFAQGSRAGARSPWLFAKSCANYQPAKRHTRFFVEQVLKPVERE